MKSGKNHVNKPPIADKRPVRLKLHGETRIDEYAWMQQKGSTAVRTYVEKENAYADAFMRGTEKLQKQLYKEIRSRMKEDDMTVPVKDGPYLYYTKTQKGKQYAIHCRKLARGGKEEILLDENVLAKGEKYFSVGAFEVSHDHRLLAYTVDTSGSEKHTLFLKDLDTGKLLADKIDSAEDIAWTSDSAYFFYTVEQHPHPPRKVCLHKIGSPTDEDELIYEEKDLQWYVGLGESRSKRYIFIRCANYKSSETRVIPSHDPMHPPQLMAKRKKDVRYYVEHHGDTFFILTNEKAENFKVMRTTTAKPERKHWRTWIPYDASRPIGDFQVFDTFIVAGFRESGAEELWIYDHSGKRRHRIPVPEREHSINIWGDIEFDSEYLRFSYSSFITPVTVYDYYPATKKLVVMKRQAVPRWDPKKYVSKREWVNHDGVRVPVSIVHKKGATLDGSAPLLLEGYGAYGITSDPYFSISKAALIDRGWMIAIAHIRGGGELGESWHKSAYLTTKHKTYLDFVAAAQLLIKKKYSSPDRISIMGGSAGGMMIGAVLNLRPDLFRSAISLVPAADVLNTSLDESLGGTRLHYDETGDPRKPAHYRFMRKWSPYEAVRKTEYPALLVRANVNDVRTPFWEAAKWVARLRSHKTDTNPLLMKTETVAGHFGKSGRYAWINDRAFDFAFLIFQLPGKKNS